MKIDLHCHSKWSKRPTLWVMQKLGCPESFTGPLELYGIATGKGMGAVTITDHNVIDACLEIAHLPHTFISSEYTTYFPEDRCKVHVLVYGINEDIHRDITQLRDNIYNLVNYLNHRRIRHVCAHPLFGVNDRLTMVHVEKLLLLFNYWEINGDRIAEMNAAVEHMIGRLTPEMLSRLADKHNLPPVGTEPWRKILTAGSDDHSSLHLARTYTEVPGANSIEEFWRGLDERRARIHHENTSPKTFARDVYGIAYQFYKSRFALERHVSKDILLTFLDRALHTRPESARPFMKRVHTMFAQNRRLRTVDPKTRPLLELARFEAEKQVREDPALMNIVRSGGADEAQLDSRWHEFVDAVSNRMLVHSGNHMADRLFGANLFDLFHTMGATAAFSAVLAPYLAAYALYSKERRFSREVLGHFHPNDIGAGPATRLSLFSDTFAETNGVANELRRQRCEAMRCGKDLTIMSCGPEHASAAPGLQMFHSVGELALPDYPELTLHCPPFLQMLGYCFERETTHLHAATPGPMGLASLGIARILGLPISGSHHAPIALLAKLRTDDGSVEEIIWRYLVWFYEQLDEVLVPSQATALELIERGVTPEKLRVCPHGTDTSLFHPNKRTALSELFPGESEDVPTFIYAGRVTVEKNLHILVAAYKALLSTGRRARLVVAGEGPYRAEMEALLSDAPAVFAGHAEPARLAALYASADALVYPSATESFGGAVIEAQACGIPVIVCDRGGPKELMLPDRTGFVVEANNVEALLTAMKAVVHDRDRCRAMGAAARIHAVNRAAERGFDRLWDVYTRGAAARFESTPNHGFASVEKALRQAMAV